MMGTKTVIYAESSSFMLWSSVSITANQTLYAKWHKLAQIEGTFTYTTPETKPLYLKGTAVEIIYAGIMVVLCGLLCWVNMGKRQYRPSKFVSGVLTVTRWGIWGLQFMTVFFSKYMAEMILKFLSVFLGK